MDSQEMAKQQLQFSQNIENGLTQFAGLLSTIIAEEEDSTVPSLEPKHVRQERIQKNLTETLILFKRRVEHGSSNLLKALIDLSLNKPDVLTEQASQEIINMVQLG